MSALIPRVAHDFLLASAEAAGEREAVLDGAVRRTWAELAGDARRFARVLQDAGLARGDRVALHLENTATCAASIFGVWLAGGVVTVVNPQTKADKLAYILNDAEVSVLVTEARTAAVGAEAAAQAPSVHRLFVNDAGPEAVDDLGAALAAVTGEPSDPGTIGVDLAALIYTSGTTGRPKGVMMSHGAMVFTTGSIIEYLELEPSDRILSFLPLAFTYGLGQLLLAARLGATLILERSFAFPPKVLERVRAERATVLPAVPTVFATIIGMQHEAPFESVRVLTNAAAGLPPAMHAGIARVFPNAKLHRMYGQTECMRVCSLPPAMIAAKPTSIGRAIPGTEAIVIGDDGEPVAPGETGILYTRGPHLMMGYWRQPELTAKHLKPGRYPGERMLCTHDHFTVDADGDLYFVDRSDDIIKTRGEKVSSVEVENALHDMPGVKTAAVIGVPDDILGQAIRAYIVLSEGATLTEQQIIRGCRGKLENYMVPREVVLVDALPQTESGKVRKKTLVESLAA